MSHKRQTRRPVPDKLMADEWTKRATESEIERKQQHTQEGNDMAMITSIFQRIFAFAPRKRAATAVVEAPTAAQDAWRHAMSEAEDQRAFVAGIAHLPAEEQSKRLRRREAYRRLAERQGVIEAERSADDVLRRP